jgi:hypothetical protein
MTSAGVAGLLLATASFLVSEEHHPGQPPSTFVAKDNGGPTEHKRQGNVGEFGAATKAPEKPFPWMALGLGIMSLVIASPFAFLYYRGTSKDLKDMKTVGRVTEGTKGAVREKGARPAKAEKPMEGGNEPRDRVWETMQSVSQWVPVDWVARSSGLSDDESAEELTALTSEGYLEQAKDKQGNPIFRTRPA